MPHAPVLVPEVARHRAPKAAATVQAMETAARRIVRARPDSIVLISPHAPRPNRGFAFFKEPRVHGSFEPFGAPMAGVDLPGDPAFGNALGRELRNDRIDLWEIPGGPLDHGALVPLWFLQRAGWNGPVLVLSLAKPGSVSGRGVEALGRAAAAAARACCRSAALIASGDMSHRLKPGAPAGFDPRAADFDRALIAALKSRGGLEAIQNLDPGLTDLAAEDATESIRFALAAAAGADTTTGRDVLSYEGPFGVGYGVAMLYESAAPPPPPLLVRVARRSLETALRPGGGDDPAPPDAALVDVPGSHGVFVTLRTAAGGLRGCMGSLQPREPDIARETWRLARAAAFEDPRFERLQARELDGIRIDVSVLDTPESVDSDEDFDPARYGVIAASPEGRRGVLLPAIEGVDSVAAQKEIALKKAGIPPGAPVAWRRFGVRKFSEA